MYQEIKIQVIILLKLLLFNDGISIGFIALLFQAYTKWFYPRGSVCTKNQLGSCYDDDTV